MTATANPDQPLSLLKEKHVDYIKGLDHVRNQPSYANVVVRKETSLNIG